MSSTFLDFSLNVNGPKYSSNFRPNRAAQIDPTRSPAKASIPKWKWNPTPPPAPPLLPPRRHAGRRSPESIAARSPSSSSNAGGEPGRRRGGSKVVSSIPLTGFHPGSYPMRSCASSLCGISRVAWRRHAVAGGALSQHHHHQQRHLVLRPPAPPPIGLALERFFSASSRRSAKRSAAAAKQSSQPPPPPSMDGGEPFYVVRKGDVIGIYKSLSDCQAQVSNSVKATPSSLTAHSSIMFMCIHHLSSQIQKYRNQTLALLSHFICYECHTISRHLHFIVAQLYSLNEKMGYCFIVRIMQLCSCVSQDTKIIVVVVGREVKIRR